MNKALDLLKKKPVYPLGIFLLAAIIMIVISELALGIPVVAVCTIVILEAALSALLNRIPIWVHGLIIIAQIVAGILVSKAVFMILMAVIYVLAVALLYLWSKEEA